MAIPFSFDRLREHRGSVTPALIQRPPCHVNAHNTLGSGVISRGLLAGSDSGADRLDNEDTDSPVSRIGTLARTRRLLLAALRVRELKQGIRD